MADGRRRYRMALPAEAQRAGGNTLAFRFERVTPLAGANGGRLAASFYSLTVGTEGDRGLEDLLARDAPAPLSVSGTALVQVGPSILRYGLRLPSDADCVTLITAGARRRGWATSRWLRTFWPRAGVGHGRVDGGTPSEVRRRSPDDRGIVRPPRVEGRPSAAFAWVVW